MIARHYPAEDSGWNIALDRYCYICNPAKDTHKDDPIRCHTLWFYDDPLPLFHKVVWQDWVNVLPFNYIPI